MKFRTEVEIKPCEQKLNIEDKIFSIGSCFATELSDLLNDGQLQTLNNPFGTMFNPYSINTAIKRLTNCEYYAENELVEYQNQYISLDHHTSFDSQNLNKTLNKINDEIEKVHPFLKESKWMVVTYGTSFIYEFLPQNKLVANCHKLPGKFFKKRLLTSEELSQSIKQTIDYLKDICPNGVKILFSVSPVRHTKDGMQENMLSKSLLISTLHQVIDNIEDCHYLPIYEIMMDDLRDYRFYKEDMIHPNNQAIKYIFNKFGEAYFSEETQTFINENFKIKQALEHRPTDEQSETYKVFREKLEEKIKLQQSKSKHLIFKNI